MRGYRCFSRNKLLRCLNQFRCYFWLFFPPLILSKLQRWRGSRIVDTIITKTKKHQSTSFINLMNPNPHFRSEPKLRVKLSQNDR